MNIRTGKHHGDHIGYDQLPLSQDACRYLNPVMIGGMEVQGCAVVCVSVSRACSGIRVQRPEQAINLSSRPCDLQSCNTS